MSTTIQSVERSKKKQKWINKRLTRIHGPSLSRVFVYHWSVALDFLMMVVGMVKSLATFSIFYNVIYGAIMEQPPPSETPFKNYTDSIWTVTQKGGNEWIPKKEKGWSSMKSSYHRVDFFKYTTDNQDTNNEKIEIEIIVGIVSFVCVNRIWIGNLACRLLYVFFFWTRH